MNEALKLRTSHHLDQVSEMDIYSGDKSYR